MINFNNNIKFIEKKCNKICNNYLLKKPLLNKRLLMKD